MQIRRDSENLAKSQKLNVVRHKSLVGRRISSIATRLAMRRVHSKALMAFLLLSAISAAIFGARARPIARATTQSGPEHVLSLPYFSIKGGWDSTLTLNNSSVSELAATITLYSLDGEALKLASLYLKPNSNSTVLLSEIVGRSPRMGKFQEGCLDVRFNSSDSMAIAPQLTVSDPQHGLSFDMEPPMMLMSSTLEGLWWSPDKKTGGQVMLSNTTDQNLDVSVKCTMERSRDSSSTDLTFGASNDRTRNREAVEGRQYRKCRD